jgi:hypothetical protein
MRRLLCLGGVGLLLGLSGLRCAPEPADVLLPTGELVLLPIEWNETPLGSAKVAAVAEHDDDIALFGDSGVALWSSGESQGKDSSVRAWRSSAVVPALGFPGRWLLGADEEGKVYRLRTAAAQTVSVEEVSARYKLAGKKVLEVASLGGVQVGFALDGRLAISDGVTLREYELSVRGLVGGSGQAAGIWEDQVVVFDSQTESLTKRDLPGVTHVAFDAQNQLWAVTREALFQLQDGVFRVMYRVDGEDTVRGLSASSSGLWLLFGQTVGLVREGQLLVAPLPSGVTMPAQDSLRIVGSPSGDAWLLGDSQVLRVGEQSGGGQDFVLWRKNMQPVFERLCQSCHLPSGSAHLDLSTHSLWARYRGALGQRVVEGMPTPMPPVGTGTLTADERAQVAAWVSRR